MVLLCAVASEGGLSVYEVRLNGTCVASLDPAGEEVTALADLGNGLLASGDASGALRVWRLAGSTAPPTLLLQRAAPLSKRGATLGGVNCIAALPGARVATGHEKGVLVWQLNDAAVPPKLLDAPRGQPTAKVLSLATVALPPAPEGEPARPSALLAVGLASGTGPVMLYNADDGAFVRQLPGGGGQVHALVALRDGLLLVAHWDGLRVWDAADGSFVPHIVEPRDMPANKMVKGLVLLPGAGATRLASFREDEPAVSLWNVGGEPRRLTATSEASTVADGADKCTRERNRISALALADDNSLLAATNAAGVRLLNTATRKYTRVVSAENAQNVNAVAVMSAAPPPKALADAISAVFDGAAALAAGSPAPAPAAGTPPAPAASTPPSTAGLRPAKKQRVGTEESPGASGSGSAAVGGAAAALREVLRMSGDAISAAVEKLAKENDELRADLQEANKNLSDAVDARKRAAAAAADAWAMNRKLEAAAEAAVKEQPAAAAAAEAAPAETAEAEAEAAAAKWCCKRCARRDVQMALGCGHLFCVPCGNVMEVCFLCSEPVTSRSPPFRME